ncbi:hypothetical protein [Vacuolonema iberomarrocanum]|uniref:hypothetical protein n=1 Tax=Vacuolonema iberomarrocanum TaxID=3454632 RepID=UPI0019FC22AC|nr:hypothetical protein [filamentous cyanobacterium LEGE 07170]
MCEATTVIWIHIFQQVMAAMPDLVSHPGTTGYLGVDPAHLAGVMDGIHSHSSILGQLLAEQFDTDVFRGFREWGSNFIESGQIWALIIGIVLGYLFRGFTTYG